MEIPKVIGQLPRDRFLRKLRIIKLKKHYLLRGSAFFVCVLSVLRFLCLLYLNPLASASGF